MYAQESVKIYLSADMTGTKESGFSIKQGIHMAFAESNYIINDLNIELIVLDHRGNSRRAKNHLQQFNEDEKALAIFCGLHSPPVLASLEYIHENEILMLDPWAAAAPITRFKENENWIFRLSIDDSKAGKFISDYAILNEKFKRPYLILENTGWGKSNEKNMGNALKKLGIEPAGISWFDWNLGINQAKVILRKAKSANADVIFFVGNAPEGKEFVSGMNQLPDDMKLPIRSHWGITGGDFPVVINKEIRSNIDLKFIQTAFSFLDKNLNSLQKKVFDDAKKHFAEIEKPEDIKAPAGFIHAYDLTKILIEAMKQSNLKGDIKTQRNIVRENLENLKNPVQCLIKTYKLPFGKFSANNPDAHEALTIKDYRMAVYGSRNEIILLK